MYENVREMDHLGYDLSRIHWEDEMDEILEIWNVDSKYEDKEYMLMGALIFSTDSEEMWRELLAKRVKRYIEIVVIEHPIDSVYKDLMD